MTHEEIHLFRCAVVQLEVLIGQWRRAVLSQAVHVSDLRQRSPTFMIGTRVERLKNGS